MTNSDPAPTHQKTLTAGASVTGSLSGTTLLAVREAGPYVSGALKSLSKPLNMVVYALWFVSLMVVAILFLSGFKAWGFALDVRVQIALVGGISLQYVVSAIPALARGIASVITERIQTHEDAS